MVGLDLRTKLSAPCRVFLQVISAAASRLRQQWRSSPLANLSFFVSSLLPAEPKKMEKGMSRKGEEKERRDQKIPTKVVEPGRVF